MKENCNYEQLNIVEFLIGNEVSSVTVHQISHFVVVNNLNFKEFSHVFMSTFACTGGTHMHACESVDSVLMNDLRNLGLDREDIEIILSKFVVLANNIDNVEMAISSSSSSSSVAHAISNAIVEEEEAEDVNINSNSNINHGNIEIISLLGKLEKKRMKRYLYFVFVLSVVSFFFSLFIVYHNEIINALISVAAFVKAKGEIGILIMLCIIILFSFPSIGHSTTIIMCGFIYGWTGFIIGWSCSMIGAVLAFLIASKYLHKPLLGRLSKKWLMLIEAVVISDTEGRIPKVSFLLVLSPIPFAINNLILGVSRIPFSRFFFAKSIGVIPKMLRDVYFGVSASNLAERLKGHQKASPLDITLLSLGIAMALLVSFIIGRIARRELLKYTAKMAVQSSLNDVVELTEIENTQIQ